MRHPGGRHRITPAPTAVLDDADLAGVPDLTLFLDPETVIREVRLGRGLSGEDVDTWRGRAWADTVAGADPVRRMVEDARLHGVSDFRQVRQCFPSGREIEVEFSTVWLGRGGGFVAIGRSPRMVAALQSGLAAAQQGIERDAWQHRDLETRYRLLFHAAEDPVLMLRAEGLQVLEANEAAVRATGLAPGAALLPELLPQERDGFLAMLERVRTQGPAPGMVLRLGAGRAGWNARASLADAAAEPVYLLRLAPSALPRRRGRRPSPMLDALFDRLPDGFLLLDVAGSVCHANRAFLELVQAPAPEAVIGAPLCRWLTGAGGDASILLACIRRYGTVRRFVSTLRGLFGTEVAVEVSAAATGGQGQAQIGMVLRDVAPRRETGPAPDELAANLAGIMERVGEVPLPNLVREAGAAVERRAIERALQRAGGNRTAAAGLLGFSRQSLYAKLSRYGLDDAPEASGLGA